MSSDQFDDKQNLPPWLRDVPLPPRPRDAAPVPGNTPSTALPEWLRDLGDPADSAMAQAAPTTSEPSVNELPEWLRELEPAAPDASTPAAEPPPAAAELPGWLRESTPSPESGEAPAASLPEWLRQMNSGAPADEAPPASNLPAWLREAQAAAPPAASDPASESPVPADSGLPSWLADLSSETAPEEPAAPPDWLRDTSPAVPRAPDDQTQPGWLSAPTEQPPAAEENTLPGWLSTPPKTEDQSSLAPFDFDETPPASGRATPSSSGSWLANDLAKSEDMPAWLNSAPNESASTSPTDVPLWLQDRGNEAAPPAPEPAVPTPEATPAGDLPDWLRDTEQASATQEPATSPTPEATPAGDLPDWLRDTASAVPAEPVSEDVPAWLRENAPAAPASPAENMPPWLQEPTAPPVPEPLGDVPDWLRENTPVPPAEPVAEPTDTPPSEVPDWLRNAAASAAPAPPSENMPAWLQEPAPPPAPSSAAPTDELPVWLRESAPSSPAAQQPAAPAADDLPAWLKPASDTANTSPAPARADELPPWLRDESGKPLPMAGAPGDDKLPSWLHGANTEVPPTAAPEPTGAWLGDTAPSAAQPPAASADEGLVGGVELPPWLRPIESEPPKEEINPTDARSLDWLTRLGAQDEEESEAAPDVPSTRLAPPTTRPRTAAQIEALALLEQLAAEPFPAPAPAAAPAAPSLWRRIGVERLLYLLLLVAVVVALLVPAPNFFGLTDPPSAPGTADLFNQIDALTANDIVLVGYEWDARRSGELRPLEQAVLDHLIQHQVKLVLISTDAQGSLLLYDLRDRLGVAGYKPSGEDYILLGYKPGAELALRAIAQNFPATLTSDFQGNDASNSLLATTVDRQQRLKTLGDFSMILVLGDEAADVQGWMEQVRPSARHTDGSYVPFGFVLPAETAPIVQPYLSQPGVLHVAGTQGALAYQQLRGTAAAQVVAGTSQHRFSLLLYLVLLVAGAIVVGIYSAANRGRKQP